MVSELAATECDAHACKAIEHFAALRLLSKKIQTCPPLVDLLELPTFPLELPVHSNDIVTLQIDMQLSRQQQC